MNYKESHEFQELPDYMHSGIEMYIDDGVPPGGFLEAVFANDLVGAAARADSVNIAHLKQYAAFMYHQAPMACRGSYEKVAAWRGTKHIDDKYEPQRL